MSNSFFSKKSFLVMPFIALFLIPCALVSAQDKSKIQASAPATSEKITLDVGKSIQFKDGGQLTYKGVINDSRCPAGARCVWAGDAEISMKWEPRKGDIQDVRLHEIPEGENQAHIGKRTLTLLSLARGKDPAATFEISLTP